jgi:predicted ATPase
MLRLLGPAPAWLCRGGTPDAALPLPNTLPGWTVAFLAVQGDWVAREHLLALLWPDAASTAAQHSLRETLRRVRGLLASWGEEGALEAERMRVRLALPTDLVPWRHELAAAGGPAVPPHPNALLASFTFTGFAALQEWAAVERVALARQWRDALLVRLQRGSATDRADLAAQWLAAEPLDEEAMAAHVQAVQQQGRGGQAQRLFAEYRERLERELGTGASAALQGALAARLGAAAPSVVPAAPATPRRDDFVGRTLELRRIDAALQPGGPRVLTLLGPGGAGKTRLARQALARQHGAWPGGLHAIDLQDLDDVDALPARVAQRLGLAWREASEPAAALAALLPRERLLLLLDNVEQIAGFADWLDRLLGAAPGLTVLLTSRTRTGLAREQVLLLEGLAVPDESSQDLEAAGTFDAVRLFERRARAAQPHFDLSAHLDGVLDIVRTVGGLPLAVELAAAWVRVLPAAAIAAELHGSIAVLEGDPAAAAQPGRPEHASLQAVLERSWSRLTAREREALLALSVCRGSFTAATARALADAGLPLLAGLLGHSMLGVDDAGRFALHPVLAAHARQLAARDGAALAQAQDRHADWFARHLAALQAQHRESPKALADAIDAVQADAALAWQHAVVGRRHDRIDNASPAWRTYCMATGRFAQGVQLFEQAAAMGGDARAALRAQTTLAQFLVRMRNPERAAVLAAQCLQLAEAHDEPVWAGECADLLGACECARGRWQAALGWLERTLALTLEHGPRRELGRRFNNLAFAETFLGRFEAAIEHYHQGIAIHREFGDVVGAARGMNNQAFVYVARGDWAAALGPLEDALRFAQDKGVRAVALDAMFLLGTVLVELGEHDAAQRRLEPAREGFERNDNPGMVLKADCYLARIAARRGEHAAAARTLLAAVRRARAEDWVFDVLYALIFVAEQLRERGHAAQAGRVLRAVAAAPQADNSLVRTLVQQQLDRLDGAPTEPLAFTALLDAARRSESLDDLVAAVAAPG